MFSELDERFLFREVKYCWVGVRSRSSHASEAPARATRRAKSQNKTRSTASVSVRRWRRHTSVSNARSTQGAEAEAMAPRVPVRRAMQVLKRTTSLCEVAIRNSYSSHF